MPQRGFHSLLHNLRLGSCLQVTTYVLDHEVLINKYTALNDTSKCRKITKPVKKIWHFTGGGNSAEGIDIYLDSSGFKMP